MLNNNFTKPTFRKYAKIFFMKNESVVLLPNGNYLIFDAVQQKYKLVILKGELKGIKQP